MPEKKEKKQFDLVYGQINKLVQFKETDSRHAEAIIRLKHDGLNLSRFLRACITLYIEKDDMFQGILERIKEAYGDKNSKKKTKIIKKFLDAGSEIEKKYAIKPNDVEDIFDRIEQEYPDL